MDLLINSKEPTLLVINRAYLTSGKQYNKITNGLISLVLHDECHNTSSAQCHEFLLKCKKHQIPIVGFSATPLRTGKDMIKPLLEIYANSVNPLKLNLLTDYNMIFAISNNLILPPDFYWYQIESYNKIKKEEKNSEIVTQEELGSVLELLNHIIPFMQNKKLIAWCGTVDLAKKWKELFEKNYKQRKNLIDFKFGIDTSRNITEDYNLFKTLPKENNKIIKLEDLPKDDNRRMYYGSSILFCACKHREGSDIKLLDGCIFLDKVKDRGSIPFIQSIGRVLRLCPDTPDKTTGIIIDGFVKENNHYEKEFIDKIFGYYLSFRNLTEIDEQEKSNYEKYIEMRDIVTFDKEKQVINMNLNNKIIKINCNKLEWAQIIGKFDDILQKKIKLGSEDNFCHKATILKEKFGFNENTNFVKAYQEIDNELKLEYNLPDINSEEYSRLINKKTWYQLLDLKPDFYTIDELKKKLFEIGLGKYNENNWYKLNKKDSKIPKYPEYFYNNFSYNMFGEKQINIDL
jgi:superfamily II DNA or RNA helicase